ncbi:MAG: leucine-rich repeat domain-containing protein [Clostridia bacterium]|nr:leucine-rich repeat domain-containing protein [Clostridia bacterium]
MKKVTVKGLFIALLALVLFVTMAVVASAQEAAIVESGTCGDNLTWTLDSEGTLTVSGNGYIYGDLLKGPFCEKSLIKKAVIEQGVYDIGAYTFQDCENLTSVSLPNGITTIDNYVFSSCHNLKDITIPNTVRSIQQGTFSDCSSLTSIVIPEGVEEIGWAAFSRCSSLTSVHIPTSVTFIALEAFADCNNISDVYYAGSKAQWNSIHFGNEGEGNEALLNANIHFASSDSGKELNFFQRIIQWFRNLFARLFGR